MKLSEAVELYLAGLNCESTARQYRYVLERFQVGAAARGVVEIEDVTTGDVLGFKADQSRLAPNTRSHRLAVVRTFLNTAERAGWLPHSPASHLRGEGTRRRRQKPSLSTDEQRRVIAAAESERDRVLLVLLFATGARIGELASARVGDWDGRQLRLDGKTGERLVPLALWAAEPLRAYLAARGSLEPSQPLLAGRQGGLEVRQARNVFYAACQRAGLAVRGPHQARHAAAQRWVVNGVPIMVVSALLGHSRVSTTVDFYLQADEALMTAAVTADHLLEAA